MDEDRFNIELRKFLKQVGVTSQREVEALVRSGKVEGKVLGLKMVLTSDDGSLHHVVEDTLTLE